MRALLAGLLIACLGAAAAAAAGEGTLVATPRFVPAAEPVIAGPGRVAWVTRRDDAVLDLWISDRGSGPRRVQRFSGADGERLMRPRLSASAEAIGLALRVTDRRGRRLRTLTYAGPFGAPLAPAAALPPPPAAALWPGMAASVTRGCESAEIRVVARPDDAPADVTESASACELRLRSPPRLVGRRLRLGISCAGFLINCDVHELVVRAGGRVVAAGGASYNHATPPYAAADLRVSPARLRLLRAATRLRVTASVGDEDVAADTRTTVVQFPAARR